jgi:23S rRNA pseudouridine1911/1915/1917 synthase
VKALSIPIREDAQIPLDRWLATALCLELGRPVPRGLVRKAIVSGLVAIGGRIAKDPSTMPRKGPSVFVRHFDWLPDLASPPDFHVLYEDDAIIAVDKPAGLSMHANRDQSRPSLESLVGKHVEAPVFIHHRLDAATSGVVVFAKAAAANAALARAFSSRAVEKTYLALVVRPPIDWPERMSLDSSILVAENGTVRADPAGKSALTHVRVLERRAGHLLLEARLVTGRKHQIRVHLSALGAPIVGDTRYGGPPAPRLMLHAERLELDHPITGGRVVVASPRPEEFGLGSSFNPARRSHRLAGDRPAPTKEFRSRPSGALRIGTKPRKGSQARKPPRGRRRGSRH